MTKLAFTLLAIYAAYVLDATRLGNAGGVRPDWLILVAALGVRGRPTATATLIAAACGLLTDALYEGPLGLSLAILTLLGWSLSTLRQRGRWNSMVSLFATTFVLTTLHRMARWPIEAPELLATLHQVPATGNVALTSLLGVAALTALWTLGLSLVGSGVARLAGRSTSRLGSAMSPGH